MSVSYRIKVVGQDGLALTDTGHPDKVYFDDEGGIVLYRRCFIITKGKAEFAVLEFWKDNAMFAHAFRKVDLPYPFKPGDDIRVTQPLDVSEFTGPVFA